MRNLHPPSHSAGIALVSVLWLVMLLSGLAATVAYIARVEALLARRSLDLAGAQAAADAAIINTISGLSDEQVSRRPQLGIPESWQFDSVPVTVVVSNEAGRLDVNTVRDELLLAFLQAAGATGETASRLLRGLREWQGPNASAHLNGLQTTEELRQIPGWREQNLSCWLDSLTVYSRREDVAVSEATPGALAALQWLRAHDPDHSNQVAPGATAGAAGAAFTVTLPTARSMLGEVVRIRASAIVGEVNTTSEWIGRLTGDASRPMLTMRWDHEVPAAPSGGCGKSR